MLIEKERECDRQGRETNQVRVGYIRMKPVCVCLCMCVCVGGWVCVCMGVWVTVCVRERECVCVWKG